MIIENSKKEIVKIKKETEKVVKETGEIVKETGVVVEKKMKKNERIFKKHHFLFGFIGTIGIVSVITGVQGLLLKVPILGDNYYFLAVFGFSLLFIIGALHKRLQEG